MRMNPKHVCIKSLMLSLSLLISPFSLFAQSYNAEKVSFTNYLVRMYKAAPFSGVRVVDDYDDQYLISVLSLDKTKFPSEDAMNRVASVKAMSQASRFFNGSRITSDLIIRTSEKSDGTSDTEIIENIQENSVGFVKALEQLTNFSIEEAGIQVFIFSTIVTPDKKKKR